jgi:hypothetical protein
MIQLTYDGEVWLAIDHEGHGASLMYKVGNLEPRLLYFFLNGLKKTITPSYFVAMSIHARVRPRLGLG